MNESSPKSDKTASSLVSATETLELLRRLRQALSGITGRAGQVERDYTTRATRLRAQFEQANHSERSRRAAETEAATAIAHEQRKNVEAGRATRKERLVRAHAAARKRRLAEIDAEEGKRTFEAQRGLLEAGRVRDEDSQTNKTTFDTFSNRLAAEQTALEALESKARFTLGGYRSFLRLLAAAPKATTLDLSPHENQLIEQLHERLGRAARELARCRWRVLPVLFKVLPWWLWLAAILLAPFATVPELRRFDFDAAPLARVAAEVGAGFAGFLVLYWLGKKMASRPAQAAITAIREARNLLESCTHKAEASFSSETERIAHAYGTTTERLNHAYDQAQADARLARDLRTRELEEQARRLDAKSETRSQRELQQIQHQLDDALVRLEAQSTSRQREFEGVLAEGLSRLDAALTADWQALTADWQAQVLPIFRALDEAKKLAEELFPPWSDSRWQKFTLPDNFPHAARFAELEVDLARLGGAPVSDPRLTIPAEGRLKIPLLLSVPRHASVLFETKQSGQEQVIGTLNNLILRLFTSAPPGRLAFTIFDPVGLGQNFAGLMHLADYEEHLINSRIWTQTGQFEQRLADLSDHIEKVTQMYLRNEYETLAEYNAQAGRMAEKYHFLVIADFPANFSDTAVKRIMNIAASGPRCGVHLLIHWDQRRPAPLELVPEELRKNCLCLVPAGDGFAPANSGLEGVKLLLDAPPDPELATRILQQIGRDSIDSNRVEMPFAEITPPADQLWSLDTAAELRVPIGRTGATKMQHLALGKGTRQHGLIAGKTGSGKSTLFHVIITNLALWCSPEQVEFYLVDFKKGVEFKCYANRKLPHARVIAIESDREFGLSVLQRVDEELRRRGDLFRKLGAQDIPGFKKAGGQEPIPRTLLIIDEFQEFFTEDDRVAQGAALLLDRIVRQGRAFGIHVLLGSQTLGGAYTLARATIGQMVVRIALQCSEADAYLIMNEDNPAPRLLSRPGEAIYNDDAGAVTGNTPFQVVWLPDQVRDGYLEKVQAFAERHVGVQASASSPDRLKPGLQPQRAGSETGAPVIREPIVFEGNAPADVRDNTLLRAALAAEAIKPAGAVRVWLGAPNSIKGPTEAVLRRQSGNNLLIVGQREEAALGMLVISLISLAAQHPKSAAQFLVFDTSPAETPEARLLEQAVRALPHAARLVKAGEVSEVLGELAAEFDRRSEPQAGTSAPEIYLLVHGLQKNRNLRFDEDLSFSPDAASGGNAGLQFNKLICEGAGLGFHVIATCDTYNNVMRFLSRKALSEFEMRVVFQMSASDSASLIDTQQANSLGLHRALFFNGHEGWLETFRPYALPDEAWLAEMGRELARLHA